MWTRKFHARGGIRRVIGLEPDPSRCCRVGSADGGAAGFLYPEILSGALPSLRVTGAKPRSLNVLPRDNLCQHLREASGRGRIFELSREEPQYDLLESGDDGIMQVTLAANDWRVW